MIVSNWSRILFFSALTVVVAISCYTSVDGCLDPESTNYSIAGDRACEDCCIYPKVKLSIFHQYGDTTLFLEDTLVNKLGQEYSIIKFTYFLSDFEMLTTEEIVYEVQDSIELNVDAGTAFTKDDVIRVRRDGFSYEFGTVIFEGEGENLSFLVGLPEILNTNRFTSSVSGHPLTSDADSLFRESEGDYVFQRVQVAKGEEFKDTVIYDVLGQSQLQEVSIPVTFESFRGKAKTIIIEARYDNWFDDADFSSMSKEEIESQMALKSASMFRARI
ncbi:MAG: hypothetical protein ACJA1A_000942 [Saprospiraceae bacterium]|jgi:hypothetical protein|tara:strand:+ start:588 stop:1409 length:822 start_codon:yes stop_codon:yes gene_type:complete